MPKNVIVVKILL